MSKSCEDLTHHQNDKMADHSVNHKENNGILNHPQANGAGGRAKNRKFTFQSTIRQIERRRIAEKLSKEAEEKGKTHELNINFTV